MLKFSIPCVLSLLISALYNIVDQIFIGNSELSALGNAATGEEAKKNIKNSDDARGSYYKNISSLSWGDKNNYELMLDSSIGIEASANVICTYLKNKGF